MATSSPPVAEFVPGAAETTAQAFLGEGDNSQHSSVFEKSAEQLVGERIYLDYPSHTGTENLLMAACLADGETVIKHASTEPEVIDLACFLKSMGARISVEGTNTLVVGGV